MNQPTYRSIRLKTGESVALPRVSHILQEINKSEFVGRRLFYGNGSRAEIGTKADEMICRIINGARFAKGKAKKEWKALPEKVKNAVRAYIRWQESTGFKPRFTHMAVYSLKYGYVGELDIGGLIKNRMVIVEVKTGELHPDLHLMQLVSYLYAYMEMYPRKRISEVRLVRFNMDTGNFEDIPLTAGQVSAIFGQFIRYKNLLIEWDGNYSHRHMTTNQKQLKEDIMQNQTTAVEPYQAGEKLNKDQVRAIIKSLYPVAPETEVAKAIMLCMSYNLNPLRRHVFLIPFKNKKTGGDDWALVMGIQATRELAMQGGAYSYIDDSPRVMTNEEQIKVYGEVKADQWCAVTKLKYGNVTVNGYGLWPRNEQPYGTEKGNSGLNMAMIRSERQALCRLPNKAQFVPPPDVQVMDEAHLNIPEIIETTAEPAPAIETTTATILPLGGKFGDMLLTCWEHGDDWGQDKYHRRSHKAGGVWCQFRTQIKPLIDRIIEVTGETMDDLNELSKVMFEGKTQSQITEEQLVQLLDAYYQSHPDMFDKPEQAGLPES